MNTRYSQPKNVALRRRFARENWIVPDDHKHRYRFRIRIVRKDHCTEQQ
jgi:hypothetical protein